MSDDKEKITRRDFLCGAASMITGISMLDSEVLSQQALHKYSDGMNKSDELCRIF